MSKLSSVQAETTPIVVFSFVSPRIARFCETVYISLFLSDCDFLFFPLHVYIAENRFCHELFKRAFTLSTYRYTNVLYTPIGRRIRSLFDRFFFAPSTVRFAVFCIVRARSFFLNACSIPDSIFFGRRFTK